MAEPKLAKPAHITMTTAEWNQHTPAEQKLLAYKGRNPSPAINPQSIQSTKAQALLANLTEAKENTFALQQLWVALEICTCAPDARQFTVWYAQHHTFETLETAFAALSVWMSIMRTKEPEKLAAKTHDDKIRMASGILFNNLKKARND
jgi:hypothetical protein